MIRLEVKNAKALRAALNKYKNDAVKEFDSITKLSAQEIEGVAKRLSPIDDGTLRQSIKTEKEYKLSYKVTAYAKYSAFQEFGTGGLVNIPDGWERMAAKFKGKGVKQVNIKPHPFMYPAFKIGSKLYNKYLKDKIKELNSKFND